MKSRHLLTGATISFFLFITIASAVALLVREIIMQFVTQVTGVVQGIWIQ